MATILIVDDHPTNRQLLVTLLAYQGHRLLEAADGAEALALARREHPQLMITDIAMPGMTGDELVRQLQAEPKLAAMEVIFHTSTYSAPAARRLAQACGIKRVLPKPSDPEDILRMVADALKAPLPETAPAAAAAVASTPPASAAEGSSTLLVMDDESCNLDIAHIMLGAAGYQLLLADDIHQAVEHLQRERVDLVIADIRMRGGGGFELHRRIRDDERLRGIPFLLLSADVRPEDHAAAAGQPQLQVMERPYDMAVLVEVVARRLAERGAE